jgi:hypothetical protein
VRLLILVHRILIGSAIALGLFLVAWGIWQWRETGETSSLVLAGASGLVALALGVYQARVVKRYSARR